MTIRNIALALSALSLMWTAPAHAAVTALLPRGCATFPGVIYDSGWDSFPAESQKVADATCLPVVNAVYRHRPPFADLGQLATSTGRPELATGGIISGGCSSHGAAAFDFACDHPGRALALVSRDGGGGNESCNLDSPTGKVPGLFINGERDVLAGNEVQRRLWAEGRGSWQGPGGGGRMWHRRHRR